MSKTVIQAELPPDLVSRAREFASKTGHSDLNGLLEIALQDFFAHHAADLPNQGTWADRQKVFQALAAQSETCAQHNWDSHGAEPVTLDTYRCAYRFLECLPPGVPMPEVGAEPDGHLTLEWYRTPSRVLSVSISPEGELNYAALLGDTSRRTGSEKFRNEAPPDLLHLIRRVFAK